MKFKLLKLEKVTSTNDMAEKLIRKKNKKFGFVYADKQSKGRGTRGKKWVSEMGNFFGTFFFMLEKKYPPFNEFSIINPIIISKVIKKYCKNKKLSLKWPNDILIGKEKVCGILQEVITFKNNKYLIIGIGINIISSPNINKKYKTTSIFAKSKKKPSINEIAILLVKLYRNFFYNINSYNFTKYKKKADLMVVK
jgi:BirA family transcriptional regulator, biotin operon repressor / biotin---[acetyl-CoA-carboxylase] ligase